MAEVQQSTRLSQSHIPVFTPRKTQSTLPPGLSNTHLAAPPSRHLSVSGSPTHPSPGSTSSSTSSGLTPFRSFKNLFSSGSAKHFSNAPKSPFSGFGSLRRSIQGERSVSAPQLRRKSSSEEYPVLEIVLPHPGTESLLDSVEIHNFGRNIMPVQSSSQPVSARSSMHRPAEASSSSPAMEPTDLSTIIEADSSGISKHIPVLDDSDVEETEVTEGLRGASRDVDYSLLHAGSRKQSTNSGDSSILDLSTSRVTNEVLQAISATGPTDGWLHGIVVDDVGEDNGGPDALSVHGAAGDPDVSFNLSALDPDLAALLSPNRLSGHDQPPLRPLSASTRTRPSPLLPSAPIRSDPPRSPAFSSSTVPSRSSSPTRRQAPSPLQNFVTPNLASTSLPRLARSASERPTLQRRGAPPPLSSPNSAMSYSPERHSTSGALRSSPKAYPSLLNDDDHAARRPQTSSGLDSQKHAASRLLFTPARLSTQLSPGSTSRPPSRQLNRSPPKVWEPPPSPNSSRPSFSAATAAGRLHTSHSALDNNDRFQQTRTRMRTRERSASVVEVGGSREPPPARPSSARPQPADWLGPRTAKAFAAAGILDYDGEGSDRRPPSRFGTTRSSVDEPRSRYVPSRMAFSEAGSSSSWGLRSGSVSRAGSISRHVTASEFGGPMSESASTPRTTFSAVSTALTSISALSSPHQHLQSELQLLQERHSVETGALLSALADSQRTTRVLRDENTHLRDRLHDVDEQLAAALEEIRRLQYVSPPQLTLAGPRAASRTFRHRSSERQNYAGPPRLHSRLRPDSSVSPESNSSPEAANPSPQTPADIDTFVDRKRISTSSSLFPGPPSNMSMLMHEEGVSAHHSVAFSSRAASPASPTLVLAKLNPVDHSHKRSVSSGGNISPTTANFSMITSSPGSLNLRPEHELHLIDMPSLDLRAGYADDDGYNDE